MTKVLATTPCGCGEIALTGEVDLSRVPGAQLPARAAAPRQTTNGGEETIAGGGHIGEKTGDRGEVDEQTSEGVPQHTEIEVWRVVSTAGGRILHVMAHCGLLEEDGWASEDRMETEATSCQAPSWQMLLRGDLEDRRRERFAMWPGPCTLVLSVAKLLQLA